LINSLKDRETRKGDFCFVKPIYKVELKKIVSLLNEFKQSRNKLIIPKMSDSFTKKLYSTYLSYLPENKFGYQLKMNVDHRGSFTEFVKNKNFGQISVNITKPGIVKGNHWHNTKNEKFLVVHGNAIIRFRKISENKIYEYIISGENFEVIDVPPGYSHNIENVGKTDLITIMWANEIFDSENPDTFFLEV
jgi:UDP-2-acetamido-2,6-beta-L-arabino-hexul-4-ose reductase